MTEPVEVTAVGVVTPALSAIVPALERIAADRPDGALAVAVLHDGEPLIDVAIGCDPRDRFLLFSITKLLTAAVVWQASASQELDLDEPLAAAWPALDRASTRSITGRMVLEHRSGLAGLDVELSLDDLEADGDDTAIGVQEPFWQPGSRHGYHAFTFGTLLRGLARRRLGRGIRELVAERIATPSLADVSIGTAADGVHPRRVVAAPMGANLARLRSPAQVPPSTTTLLQRRDRSVLQDPRFLALELPGTNGIASAGGLARAIDRLAAGRLGLPSHLVTAMTKERSRGLDASLGFGTAFGTGVQRPFPMLPMLGPESWGHEAAGGSVAVHDPTRSLTAVVLTDAAPAVAGASASALAALGAIDAALRTPWTDVDDDPTRLEDTACTR